MKRLFDFFLAFSGLVVFLLPLSLMAIAIFLQDLSSPLYKAIRVGKDGKLFKMYKLRSMVAGADKSGVDSTSNNDHRITRVGAFVRKTKLDEISQLINVFLGDMSLVGPRPNVKRETDLYSTEEKKILMVKPGVTDFSSIVFSDEGSILEGSENPDLLYNQIIRPFKSRLALFYIRHQNFSLDIKLLILTATLFLSRKKALAKTAYLLSSMGAPPELVEVAKRQKPLKPTPPPGFRDVIMERVYSMSG